MYKESMRFLGLICDEKSPWQQHLNVTAKKTERTLDLLKFLSNYKWGMETEILKRIFMSMTRSKLECETSVSSNLQVTAISNRSSLQRSRLVTEAFRTSPFQNLYVESSMLPPKLRREQLTLTYAAGI